jgi:hypothetical protein
MKFVFVAVYILHNCTDRKRYADYLALNLQIEMVVADPVFLSMKASA